MCVNKKTDILWMKWWMPFVSIDGNSFGILLKQLKYIQCLRKMAFKKWKKKDLFFESRWWLLEQTNVEQNTSHRLPYKHKQFVYKTNKNFASDSKQRKCDAMHKSAM